MGYEFLKTLFEPEQAGGEPKRMGYDELVAAINGSSDIKLVNIRDGGYVSKEKYDRLVTAADTYKSELATATERLNQGVSAVEGTIDIEALKEAHKAEIEALRAELNNANKVALIRDYLEREKFTSRIAKSALIREMTKNPDIIVVEGQLVGVEKAMKFYKTEYADAFKSADPEPAPEQRKPAGPLPYFTPIEKKTDIPRPMPYARAYQEIPKA